MFDSDSPKSHGLVFLVEQNYRIGQKAGDAMAHQLKDKKGAKLEVITTIGQLQHEPAGGWLSESGRKARNEGRPDR